MPPLSDDHSVFYCFRRASRDLLTNTVLSKTTKYTASVISTLAKLNKRTLVYESSPITLSRLMNLLNSPEQLKHTSNHYRNFLLTDEEVAHQHSLTVSHLRKHYLAMGLEKLFVEEIQTVLKVDAQDVERLVEKKRLESVLKISKKEEIMEKYAILGHLITNLPGMFIINQLDYFKYTVFAPLFEGDSLEDIAEMYLAIDQKYKKGFTDIINEQIERIPDYEFLPPTRKSKLLSDTSGMMKLEQKAKITLELIEKTETYPSKVIFDKQAEEFQIDKCIDILVAQIFTNIYERVQRGENQNPIIQTLQSIMYAGLEGEISPQQDQMVNELLIEANTQLELLKLPKHFKDNLKLITHQYKKKVADQLVSKTLELFKSQSTLSSDAMLKSLSEYGPEKKGLALFEGTTQDGRKAIPLTPEVMQELQRLQSLPLDKLAENTEAMKYVLGGRYALNLETQMTELIQTPTDAKLHSIIYNPDNKDIPVDISKMSPDELAASGITKISAGELKLSAEGRILPGSAPKNSEKIVAELERIYSNKKRKQAEEGSSGPNINDLMSNNTTSGNF